MIYGLRQYIVNQFITRLNQMLTGFSPSVQVAGQYSQVRLGYPNVYVKASIPSFSSSVLGDFWGDEAQNDGSWQESYAVRIPNANALLTVSAKNEIERNKVTDEIVNLIVLGKTPDGIQDVAPGIWWRDLLYSSGLQLKTVSLAGEAEETTPQEGKLFHAQILVDIDTEFKAIVSDQAISWLTTSGIVVEFTI